MKTLFSPIPSTLAFRRVLGERVSDQRARSVERALEELLVVLVSHDRRALGDQRRQAARVIRVRMRVDDVADRLLREELLHFVDDGLSARDVLPGLDDDDVVLELDGERVVGAVDLVDAICQLR